MKVLVTGSHGLVGSHLVRMLAAGGHEVVKLSRGHAEPGEISWDPQNGQIEKTKLSGFDAVVHLAGDNIASGRWTEKKASIRDSRLQGTRLLCEALAAQENPPQVIVSSSAIGYYGNRGAEVVTEESAPGTGFLADLCRDWEAATEPARARGIRVVQLRIGIVLSLDGGALAKMLPPFQIGAGGRIGSGQQYMSWITVDELASVIMFAIATPGLTGPVNAVSPQAVTNNQFTEALGASLKRRIFPVPGFAIHLILGEMADELLLASTNVRPTKLLSSGYTFKHSELLPALQQILSRN